MPLNRARARPQWKAAKDTARAISLVTRACAPAIQFPNSRS